MKTIFALKKLGIKDFTLYGNPKDETQFLQMFRKVIGKDEHKNAILSSNPSDFEVTWEQIETELISLEAAEPMRLLKEERNRRLTETDWRFRVDQNPSQAWYDYCQELRDLPSKSNPQLDENGNLTNVTWPEVPNA